MRMRLGLASFASFCNLPGCDTINIQIVNKERHQNGPLLTVARTWTHMARTVLGLRRRSILLVLLRLVRKSTKRGLSKAPGEF